MVDESPNRHRCRVVVADDVAAMRALVRHALSEEPAIEVVGDAATGVEALAVVAAHQPDVLVLDLAMPELDGFEVLDALVRRDASQPAVVVFSGFSGDRMRAEALARGAADYVEKAAGVSVLLEAVCAAGPGPDAVARAGAARSVRALLAPWVPVVVCVIAGAVFGSVVASSVAGGLMAGALTAALMWWRHYRWSWPR